MTCTVSSVSLYPRNNIPQPPPFTALLKPRQGIAPATTSLLNSKPFPQGAVPAAWTDPQSGCTWDLDTFECSSCNLTGPLPVAWSIPGLRVLALSGNQLTGPFHHVVNGSSALESLILSNTSLSDVLGDSWPFDVMSRLKLVDFSGSASIQGVLPLSESRLGGVRAVG